MVHKTKEEAIEAWNTWKGRYVTPDPKLYRECNPCNTCADIMADDKYTPPLNKDMIGGVHMLSNGAFMSPWPILNPNQASADTTKIFAEFSIQDIFALRARWCALFPSVFEYREEISSLLRKNDRENNILNGKLMSWNPRLEKLGLPLFEVNDLRGINLGGFELSGDPFDGIFLRGVDLRFSELSLVQLDGANLYNANLGASVATNASFMKAILCGVDFKVAFLSHSRFELSDLTSSDFDGSMCYNAQFDGAILKGASICGAKFHNASFKPVAIVDKGIEKLKYADLSGLAWDDKTNFADCAIIESEAQVDNELIEYLQTDPSSNKGLLSRIYSAVLFKPSMFGIGVDLKKLIIKKPRK